MAAIYMTQTINTYFLFPFLRMLQTKFGFDWSSGFRDLWNCEWLTDNQRLSMGKL